MFKHLIKTLAIMTMMSTWCSAQAIMLSVNPSDQLISNGSHVDVNILVSGLGNQSPNSLGAYDLDLGFDDSLLGFNSITYGDSVLGNQLDFAGFGTFTSTVVSTGTINFSEFSFDSVIDLNTLQADSFVLATVNFSAQSLGSSVLALSVNSFGDALGDPLFTEISDGMISIVSNNVPEPATAFLMAAGLMGFGLRKQKLTKYLQR